MEHGGTQASQARRHPTILLAKSPSPPSADPPTLAVTGHSSPGQGGDSGELEGVLLVDARNGFNELSRKAAFWTVWHEWPEGSRFAFNCYRHAATVVLRRANGEAEFLLSWEGVIQGDPLSMIIYGIALVPLARLCCLSVRDLVHVWYADDAALAGPLSWIGEAT